MLVISNQPRASRSSDFEITRAITLLIIKITISSLVIDAQYVGHHFRFFYSSLSSLAIMISSLS